MGFEEMAAAGAVAREELTQLLAGMKAGEKKGAQVIADWVRKHKNQAGYKQLIAPKYGGLLTILPAQEE